jgi:ferric-dicitrate binding protein FerR (iron transport regulator)
MTAPAHRSRLTRRGERARTVVAALLLAAIFAALVWAASEGEALRCQRLTAAHNPAVGTYCPGSGPR